MEEKVTDRRIRKTKKALHEALLSLLEDKPLTEITIMELTTKADVNRKTFYNHYPDIYAVMDEIQDEMVDGLGKLFREELHSAGISSAVPLEDYDLSFLTQSTMSFFRITIHEFKSHPVYLKILTTPEIEHRFEKRLVQRETALLMDAFGTRIKDTTWMEYLLLYILSGSVSVIKRWTQDGYPASSEEMAQFFTTLFQGRQALEYIKSKTITE